MHNILYSLRFKLIIWFSRTHKTVLRISVGRLMQNILGLNMLLLSTRGRRTGQCRKTPLLYMKDGDKYYCVASFAGSHKHPQWFLNLVANPNVHLLVKRRTLTAIAHVTSGQERDKAWAMLVNYYPAYAKYQKRTERTIPVVRFDSVSH